jgi:hypothetical protein
MALAAVLLGVALTVLERDAANRVLAARVAGLCPSGTDWDRPRAARVVGLLASTERGRQLRQQAARAHVLCFGPTARSALVGRGDAVILDETLGDAENAARLGHLLSHATSLAALPDLAAARLSCDAFVDGALRAEARAHAVERELLGELGGACETGAPPPGKASPARPGSEREPTAIGKPAPPRDGAEDLATLGRQYRAWCETARSPRATTE